MSVSSGTATGAELNALYIETAKLEVMLRQYNDGSADSAKLGRFTAAAIDTQITALQAAISAVNAG